MKLSRRRAAQPDVVTSSQIARKFLVSKHHQYGAIRMSGESHPGFDEDIWPRLEAPGARVFKRRVPGEYSFIGSEEGGHRLGIAECLLNGLADVGAGTAG